jgi:23S rRNA (guanosine2251-2'-O)-methyltransferase
MAKRKRPRGPRRPPRPPPAGAASREGGAQWLYGTHAALAALGNPRRRPRRLLLTAEARAALGGRLAAAGAGGRPEPEIVPRAELDRLLPPGAVHQGIALLAQPLEPTTLEDALGRLEDRDRAVVLVLDQATDPRNVGAVLRAAAAFAAAAVVVQARHAPRPTAALAKAASGALELVPLVPVTNIARALARLKESGFRCVGLDPAAPAAIAEATPGARVALVIGSEGKGLRRLVREGCDLLVRIPIEPAVESLNLATAAAIALYELARGRPRGAS